MDLHAEELYAVVRQLRAENLDLRRGNRVLQDALAAGERVLAETQDHCRDLTREVIRLRRLYPAACGD